MKRHTDGLLYWTINGEFMRDADGKMIPAQGKDGENGADGTPGVNGVTPQMRVNTLLQWEVSLDGGKTWQTVKDANGNPVSAQGPKGEPGQPGNDGDANLSITETADAIIIVYKGVTYTLPKGGGAPPAGFSITMTTAKAVGEKIKLYIDAPFADRDGIWIDLNNNGQQDGESEKVTQFRQDIEYTLGAKTVTLHGKITDLRCNNNNLTALDVSNNTALTVLYCYNNELTALDVSNNTKLLTLYCNSNQLQTLDVSNNKELTSLSCYANQLQTLDISNNKELTSLSCGVNQLETLDVSNNTALKTLSCSYNPLKTLNVSHNTALTKLYCNDNELTTLDVSKNTALTELYCVDNELKTLDISKNTALTLLYCHYNELKTLDVSKNTALALLWCYNNQIKADAMTALVQSLRSCPADEKGKLKPYGGGNEFNDTHKTMAEGKNWVVER